MAVLKQLLTTLLLATLFVGGLYLILAGPTPQGEPVYGVTFSKFRADELGLPWQETYDALLQDLGVTRFRLVAHWPMIEPEEGQYDFTVLDYQMREAKRHGASVILAIGRRLPSWPECHEPDWARALSKHEREDRLLHYMEAVVTRYKDSPALAVWQVENEPFIIGYAYEHCGDTNVELLEEEIALVRTLDPVHPVLLTASGELGLWNRTWAMADIFGTTLYRSVWSGELQRYITYPTTPGFFRAKRTFTGLATLSPQKPTILAELAAEPWPVAAVVATPLSVQIERMSLEAFNDTIHFASETGFDEQYFWGAEWWYYMKKVQGHEEYWQRAKELFGS